MHLMVPFFPDELKDEYERGSLCEPECNAEPVYGDDESKTKPFLPSLIFSETKQVSRARSSRLISSRSLARSQVSSLMFIVTSNFTSWGSFSNINVDINA